MSTEMWWHKHDLQLVARTYAPPLSDVTRLRVSDQSVAERMIHGCTTYIWKCAEPGCGHIRTVIALGKETP